MTRIRPKYSDIDPQPYLKLLKSSNFHECFKWILKHIRLNCFHLIYVELTIKLNFLSWYQSQNFEYLRPASQSAVSTSYTWTGNPTSCRAHAGAGKFRPVTRILSWLGIFYSSYFFCLERSFFSDPATERDPPPLFLRGKGLATKKKDFFLKRAYFKAFSAPSTNYI